MRYIRFIIIVLILSAATYFLSLNMFMGLKIEGYSYLFNTTLPYDLVIKHALILDGTGQNKRYRGDIAFRGGKIVGVGYVNPEGSPVFDAGGLTLIPAPQPLEKNEETLEHVFSTSYPRYPAQHIYLQEGLYQGLSLEQTAEVLGLSIEGAFKILKESPGLNPKAVIIEIPRQEEDTTLQEYLARLTGYRATYYNHVGQGVVKAEAITDLYLFKSRDFTDEELLRYFKQGKVPQPIYIIKNGKFANQ